MVLWTSSQTGSQSFISAKNKTFEQSDTDNIIITYYMFHSSKLLKEMCKAEIRKYFNMCVWLNNFLTHGL